MTGQLTCKELVELVTDYLEGAMAEPLRLRVENHLAGCNGCTTYLEQMRLTIQLTGNLKEEQLTPSQRAELLKMFEGWKKA